MPRLAWVSVLIALVCFAPAGNGQKPCPPGCKSFVTLGNLAGKQEIGPAAEMAWNVLSTSTYTVNRVSVRIALLLSKSNLPKVSIFVSGNQIFNFEVNTTVIQFSFSYDFMSGAIVGNGSVLLLPGIGSGFEVFGLSDLSLYIGNGMGTAIPQLVVKFQGVADGASGGVNGSLVVFNVNQPDPSNYLDLGSVQLSWTACISKSGPFPRTSPLIPSTSPCVTNSPSCNRIVERDGVGYD